MILGEFTSWEMGPIWAYMGVSENSVPLNPMVLLIIIPIKWLFHWEYTHMGLSFYILYILYLGEVYPLSSSSPPVAGTGGTKGPWHRAAAMNHCSAWRKPRPDVTYGRIQGSDKAGSRPKIKCGMKNMEKIPVLPGFYTRIQPQSMIQI